MFLFFYNLVLNLISPFLIFAIICRIFLGKENKLRYKEKFGISNAKKVKNIKMIWFHACSVGEVKSISNLTKEFLERNYSILITTNTLLSANFVKRNFSKLSFKFILNNDLMKSGKNVSVTNGKTIK